VAGTWGAGYGVADVSAVGDVYSQRLNRRRCIAGIWIIVYVGDFDKYIHILYVFTNKHSIF
jgi:hypothetical protein